jgi:glycogen phosphorylase
VPTKQISEKQIDALCLDLRELAYNLWWSWNPSAQLVFHELSPFFWEHSNHSAVEVINWISGQELRSRLHDPQFFERVSTACQSFRVYSTAKETWVRKNAPAALKRPVAYFSAEFGLHESLRTYSGGLGILAGDHAKSASDLGLPFVGITLFYRQGYFQQQISNDGWQMERYPTYEPERLPITLVRNPKGDPVVCTVEIGSETVHFQGWAVAVGRGTVYLLDTDLPQNSQHFRNLTAHVYGGDQWTRIGQESVLGIGGVRFLRAIGVMPGVFHMNEGHSAFLTLELLREQIAERKFPADDGPGLAAAEAEVKKHCVFTTHTPVAAGHDRFDRSLMQNALARFSSSLGMTIDAVMRYGRIRQDDENEAFCMTVLALRMCRSANGVSELHGHVSRQMWKDLYPGTPVERVPIGYVTNGVHTTGWASHTASRFWTNQLGPKWNEHIRDAGYWHRVAENKTLTDEELWSLRTILRRELVEFSRRRLREQNLRANPNDVGLFDNVLSPEVLTIGFARRFATYKRAPLFFRDLEWAIRILSSTSHPVQLVFAGKAHPRDDAGKRFIQEIVNISKRVDLFGKVVFIEDYDINVARHLVAGADVWLNTPRRPMEASGTSGMKALIHGGLHFSTMDGWWREGFNGSNGWKIGEDTSTSSEHEQDDLDGASLRSKMENEIIPLFYERGRDGIPHKWIKKIRHSMASLIPIYNTDRMVMEYIQKCYLPEKPRKQPRRSKK